MPIFEVKNLKYKYDKLDNSSVNAIDDVSFNIEKGEIVALIGKSGSGKSTLISHLNGLIKADSGSIIFNGQDIYDKSFNLKKLRFECGIVFQHPEYQLFADTVIEDVMFGAIKMGMSKDEAYNKSIETLKMFGIEHLKDEVPFNLSGGEKRKVAFAGVFVMSPKVLILDEPDAGLDPISKNSFFKLLMDLNAKYNTTILFITHNLDDVVEYADKAILLNDGKLVAVDKPINILLDEDLMNKSGLCEPYAISIYKYLKNKSIALDKDKLKFSDLKNQILNL